MLDEFPALGRLDFFESALAFMAGYGLKSFLIAQSLNQIEKAYGQNNGDLSLAMLRNDDHGLLAHFRFSGESGVVSGGDGQKKGECSYAISNSQIGKYPLS